MRQNIQPEPAKIKKKYFSFGKLYTLVSGCCSNGDVKRRVGAPAKICSSEENSAKLSPVSFQLT